MNSVTMIGNLTKDPQINWAKNGEAIAHFDIAVNRMKEGVDYFRVTVFGKQAENCERYLAKGRKVAVMGRLQNGSYDNKDGFKSNMTRSLQPTWNSLHRKKRLTTKKKQKMR